MFHIHVFILCQAVLGGHSASTVGQLLRRQSRKVVQIGAVGSLALEDDPTLASRWVTSAFSDCTSCPAGARQIRKVSCRLLSGDSAPENLCNAKRKPLSFKSCSCAPNGMMPCTGNVDRCVWTLGDTDHSGTNKDQDFTELGCFKKTSQMSAPSVTRNTPGNDYGCQGWSATVPCHGGLPFYAFQSTAMSPTICFEFCLGKGLDIFGLDESSGQVICRCGASPGLFHTWDHAINPTVPTPNLVFDMSSLRFEQNNKALCPLRIFRYTGHLTDGSIPYHRTYLSASDIKYKEEIVCNCNITNAKAEDRDVPVNVDSSSGAALAANEELGSPNWERKCYPSNCQAGFGPWGGSNMPDVRTQQPPPGVQSGWQEYTVIKYLWEPDVDDSRKEAFRRAASNWMAKTCIVFLESQSDTTWPYFKVGIYDTDSCWSDLGRPKNKHWIQELNLGWCNSMNHVGNIMHELGHMLGMSHYQKRPDAASTYFAKGPFLRVYWQNIDKDWAPQYLADSDDYMGSANDGAQDPWSGYSPYDFESIMHYPAGKEFDTIPVQNKNLVGQRQKLSVLDIRQINDVYQCKLSTQADASAVPASTTLASTTTVSTVATLPRTTTMSTSTLLSTSIRIATLASTTLATTTTVSTVTTLSRTTTMPTSTLLSTSIRIATSASTTLANTTTVSTVTTLSRTTTMPTSRLLSTSIRIATSASASAVPMAASTSVTTTSKMTAKTKSKEATSVTTTSMMTAKAKEAKDHREKMKGKN